MWLQRLPAPSLSDKDCRCRSLRLHDHLTWSFVRSLVFLVTYRQGAVFLVDEKSIFAFGRLGG